jgi:hypothetical protein
MSKRIEELVLADMLANDNGSEPTDDFDTDVTDDFDGDGFNEIDDAVPQDRDGKPDEADEWLNRKAA